MCVLCAGAARPVVLHKSRESRALALADRNAVSSQAASRTTMIEGASERASKESRHNFGVDFIYKCCCYWHRIVRCMRFD